MSIDDQKRLAGEAAAALVEDGMTVGLGTGSTAVFFIEALAARARTEGLKLVCVPTSTASAALGETLGLRILDLNEVWRIDLTVDGADEIGPGLVLIKGGGAALLREKLVWEASDRCVVIADAAKVVQTLGLYPLPVEVVAFGHAGTAARIRTVLEEHGLGATPKLRMRDGGPLRTDGGGVIYDLSLGVISDPERLGPALKAITGVVEHGLFIELAAGALVGTDAGVVRLSPNGDASQMIGAPSVSS